ncbi:hypothetical protein PJI17_31930, partial [Mycobacterium kansasii]
MIEQERLYGLQYVLSGSPRNDVVIDGVTTQKESSFGLVDGSMVISEEIQVKPKDQLTNDRIEETEDLIDIDDLMVKEMDNATIIV